MTREEAINEVKKAMPTICKETKEALNVLISELAESEDEKIRKSLVEYFSCFKPTDMWNDTFSFSQIVAYIEKQKEQTEELSTRLNGLMQEYVKSGKDEEEQEHRLKCYQLFWDALGDSEFFEQKEQKPELCDMDRWDEESYNNGIHHVLQNPKAYELTKQKSAEYADDVVEEAEEYTSKVACGEYGVEVTEAYIAGVLSERKRGTKWSEFDKGVLKDAICATDRLGNDEFFNKSNPNLAKAFRVAKEWLKSLPERFNLQLKNEWSEDYNEEKIQTRFAFYTYKDDPSVLYLSNVFVEETSRNHGFGTRILKAAEKVAESVGATTIRLKVKQNSPANAWYRKNGYGYATFEDGYDWLEKNLEYVNPNEQDWSKEDEEKLRAVISLMKSSRAVDPFYDKMLLEGWLKSLPLNLKKKNDDVAKLCSNEWSKEDEETLACAISVFEDFAECKNVSVPPASAKRYLKQLKALRPQPKQEWSEEDEKIVNNIVSVLGQYIDYKQVSGTGTGYATPRYAKEIDWLKSLRPQPKQEWSEEDKDYYDAIIAKLEVTQDDAMLTDNQMDFLKSLPERFNLQPKQEQNDYITPHKEFFKFIYDRLINVYKENPNVDYMRSFKERLDNLSFEEKQEWSEEDKEMLIKVEQILLKHWNSLSDSFYHKHDDENQDTESCYNWLKSLPLNHKKNN